MANNILTPFQLLELNVISAQDLANVSRKMRTYAVAWVHPDHKLCTRVDVHGQDNPTWNDKFVYRVDDEFLYGDTSAIMIEIYAVHWFRDIHVGTVRIIVGNLIPPPIYQGPHQHHHDHLGMRFVALQVRRPSGRPQGILNIGVALLDSSMRSMPLYSQLNASALGYRHLMGETDPHTHHNNTHNNHNHHQDKNSDDQNSFLVPWIPKPELRRTKSDSSSMIAIAKRKAGKISPNITNKKNERTSRRSKASSLISGSELIKRGYVFKKGGNGKPSSLLTGSDFGPSRKTHYLSDSVISDGPHGSNNNTNKTPSPKRNSNSSDSKYTGSDNDPNGMPGVTDSELGPSPSEVAANKNKHFHHHHQQPAEEAESETVADWSLESSMEGLQSKLHRWRMELPPIYDRSKIPSFPTESIVGGPKTRGHRRRRTDGGGLFSCFGHVCGLECSIVCGGSSVRRKGRRFKRSQSLEYLSLL